MGARPTLETTRLVLEPLGLRHAEGVWAAVERSLPELRNWMSWAVDPDKDESLAFIRRADAADDPDGHHFAIVFQGDVVGVVSLLRGEPRMGYVEIGYWIESRVAGRGLMTEAASAVVAYGFDVVGFHRIELRAATGNVGSIRVAEKLGFQREGVAREASRAASGWLDVDLFALLETDPRPGFHA